MEEDDQITHYLALDDDLNLEDGLDVFKYDPDYEQNEEKYKEIKAEILGESDGEEESGTEDGGVEGEEEEDETTERDRDLQELQSTMQIHDNTETNIVNLRRVIYLTVMSSIDFEEACHKLLKLSLKPGQEVFLSYICSI